MNLIVHFDEIFLKGNNQKTFIDCLKKNIRDLFTDVKVKQVGKTLSLAKGNGGAVGTIKLQYGAYFVEFNSLKNEYIVLLQPHDDTLGTIRVKKDSGGFHILSDLKNDFGTVDYMVVKANET